MLYKRPAFIVLIVIVIMSTGCPLFLDYLPVEINLDSIKEPPSWSHPFGTDSKGRDVLSRVLYGGRVSLAVCLLAGVLSLFVGFTVGLIAGFYGGFIDMLLMGLVDFLLSFPTLLLAIGISLVLPPGFITVVVAITAVGWVAFARVIRSHVLKAREMEFVEAAKALGCSNFRIIIKHILPECLPIAIVLLGLKLSGFILTEAALSFLGLGVLPPTPSWGSMISENRAYLLSEPWMVIFPGLFIAATALCFNLIGDFFQKKVR